MAHEQVTANGIDFAYLEAGPPDGPLALCLHGFPDHAPTYGSLLTELAGAGFHAVAPWMRGYAPTAVPPDERYHTAYLALDAIALTDALAPRTGANGGDAYLVGHDWGAGAVGLAASYRPERFRKIVTLAVPPQPVIGARFISSPDQLKRSWYIWFFQTPLADMAVPMNDFAFIDKLWADWSPGYTPAPEFMRGLKDTFASSIQNAIGYYRHTFGGQASLEGEASEVAAAASTPYGGPHLYLHGTDDGCLGAELIDEEALREALGPDGEYQMVEGAGHFLHLERPEVVNPKIVGFLRG